MWSVILPTHSGRETMKINSVVATATALTMVAISAVAGLVFAPLSSQYDEDACDSGGVCKLVVASQNTSAPITLMPGEAASMDITPTPGSSGVRAVVVSNRRNVRATAAIINTLTGETI